MQLASVFSALAVVVAVEDISQRADGAWVRRGLALGLVGLAVGQLLIFFTSFPQMVATKESQCRIARTEFEGLKKVIAASSAPTLLLINDQAAYTTQAMLEMAARPKRGRVKRLITVDNFAGESSTESTLRISRDDRAVRIEIDAGPGQTLAFANVVQSRLGSEFVNQGLHYEIEIVRTRSFLARLALSLGMRVEPDRVAIGHRLVVTVPPRVASEGLLVVGFDPRDTSTFSNDLLR
jgi:hypothetical protein